MDFIFQSNDGSDYSVELPSTAKFEHVQKVPFGMFEIISCFGILKDSEIEPHVAKTMASLVSCLKCLEFLMETGKCFGKIKHEKVETFIRSSIEKFEGKPEDDQEHLASFLDIPSVPLQIKWGMWSMFAREGVPSPPVPTQSVFGFWPVMRLSPGKCANVDMYLVSEDLPYRSEDGILMLASEGKLVRKEDQPRIAFQKTQDKMHVSFWSFAPNAQTKFSATGPIVRFSAFDFPQFGPKTFTSRYNKAVPPDVFEKLATKRQQEATFKLESFGLCVFVLESLYDEHFIVPVPDTDIQSISLNAQLSNTTLN